ncbi:MAG TPA: siderophore-interacting protein [Solirubrobacteraceae bacterium]|nr:siderophore-interacting protein [Solirubrobacteraceae bacterium]
MSFPRRARVLEKRTLTPQMVRIVFGGAELDGFGAGEFTDHYVKLRIGPRTRTYTVRDWDGARLTIDSVVHGDEGVAGPWAAAAEPGDELELRGPGGAYTPDPDADWHLMIGDAAVIPAIAASLARVPAGVPVHVLVAVDGPGEEQPLSTPGDLHLRWLPDDAALVAAVADLDFPAGKVHAFVHGEASTVRELRRHLVVDRGLPRDALSVSGYWKRTRTEEGWREDKAEWNRLVEQDAAAA